LTQRCGCTTGFFAVEFPDREENFLDALNPNSLTVLHGCKLEPALAHAKPGDRVQFERAGYFSVDPKALATRRAGLQPYRRLEGHLGEDRENGEHRT